MSSTLAVLSTTTALLTPGQNTTIQPPNGTAVTLILSNLSPTNSCGWSVSGVSVTPSSGVISPGQQQAFPANDYQGTPMTITNTTSPSSLANLQIFLG